MAQHNIEKYNIFYALLRWYCNILFHRYYKRIETHGYNENVPKEGPIIFAANHQNALIDALAIISTQRRQLVFLARSDIFENTVSNKILTFFKILPIYRIRDGKENLQKNDYIFNKTMDILLKGKALGILPEGNHAGFRKLRVLKKGIARISFQAAEKSDYKLPLKIIPVGLEYVDYVKFRKPLFVNYGKPLDVSDYYEEYKENQQKAMRHLLNDLKERISELMIDIQDDEYYEMYDKSREFINGHFIKKKNQYSKFESDKKLVSKLDKLQETNKQEFIGLNNNILTYFKNLEKLNLRHWVFEKNGYNTLSILGRCLISALFLPIFIYGFINNYLPFKIPVWIVNSRVKDLQFHSSVKYVLILILFPLFYIIFYVVFGIIYEFNWISLVYLISIPLSGRIAFWYYIFNKKLKAAIRFKILKSRKNKIVLENMKLFKVLNEDIRNLLVN